MPLSPSLSSTRSLLKMFLTSFSLFIASASLTDAYGFHFSSSVIAEGEFYRSNQKLYNDLMVNYSKELAPFYTLHHTKLNETWDHPLPMQTHVTLTYVRIVKLDQVEQVMRVIAEIRYVWSDYRLRWNPDEYGGIEYFYINRARIWMPEITVANSYSESSSDAVPEYKQNALIKRLFYFHVNHTGHVLFYNNVLSNSVCQLETTNFPFDDQRCEFCLLETLFNKNESKVVAELGDRMKKQISKTGNGEWDVLNISINRFMFPEYHRVEFDLICYQFEVRRKSNFYVMVIIIPTFIITTLSITGIFGKRLTSEDYIGELSLGLTSLMTMTVMLGIVADSLPKTNHLPVLSTFLTIDVSLMAVAVLIVIMHPRVIYPRYRKIRSKVLSALLLQFKDRLEDSPEEDAKEHCCWPRKYRTANLIFMLLFQGINCANLYYILSYWQ